MKRLDGQTVFLGTVLVAGVVTIAYLALFHGNGHAGNQSGRGSCVGALSMRDAVSSTSKTSARSARVPAVPRGCAAAKTAGEPF